MAKAREVRRALVLQGGGALGAFELGAARALYGREGYQPDLIAGVSIGAITAVLLARPKAPLGPIAALEAFWERVTCPGDGLFASMFGGPGFFAPRYDVWNLPWTSLYSTAPLHATLAGLVDEAALADPEAMPRLVVTATDIAAGEIQAFFSGDGGMTLDHILASGALPPGFPMTRIGERCYWDGGLFDNTPLGEVVGRMAPPPDGADDREIVVVNLFPNAGAVPETLAEVPQRMLNLTFANKTASDLKLLGRFNAVAALVDEIRRDERWRPLAESVAFTRAANDLVQVPPPIAITRAKAAAGLDSSDFSRAAIRERAEEGEAAAHKALGAAGALEPAQG
jgi:NTE family protein